MRPSGLVNIPLRDQTLIRTMGIVTSELNTQQSFNVKSWMRFACEHSSYLISALAENEFDGALCALRPLEKSKRAEAWSARQAFN